MDKKHIVLSILFILPFLGLEMSPVGGSWIVSSIIWIVFIILLVIYNKQFVKQIRIRKPFILASQHAGVKAEKTPELNTNPPRLIHDSVLWEDNGNNMWGNLDVIGPLCPKDYTPLAEKRGSEVDTNLSNDTLISDSGYHSQLICPECGGEYTLGSTSKIVGDSRGEVSSRFEGMRRRNQDG